MVWMFLRRHLVSLSDREASVCTQSDVRPRRLCYRTQVGTGQEGSEEALTAQPACRDTVNPSHRPYDDRVAVPIPAHLLRLSALVKRSCIYDTMGRCAHLAFVVFRWSSGLHPCSNGCHARAPSLRQAELLKTTRSLPHETAYAIVIKLYLCTGKHKPPPAWTGPTTLPRAYHTHADSLSISTGSVCGWERCGLQIAPAKCKLVLQHQTATVLVPFERFDREVD